MNKFLWLWFSVVVTFSATESLKASNPPKQTGVKTSEEKTLQHSKEFVEKLGNEALKTINSPGISNESVFEKFKEIIETNFAVKEMALYALGGHKSKIKENQLAEFEHCFTNMLVKQYASNFQDYKTATFSVGSVAAKGKSHQQVESTIATPGKSTAKIVWSVLVSDNGDLKIDDAKFKMGNSSEVSLKMILREEIRGSISENGIGKFMNDFKAKYGK